MRDTADLVLLTGAVDETAEATDTAGAQPERAVQRAIPVCSANVAPTDPVRVLLHAEGRRRLRRVRWGLVPPWSRDTAGAARMINARVETVADRPAYRRAIRTARCVLPADGWYEWRRSASQGTRSRVTRTPYLVRRTDGAPLWLAGIWAQWDPPGGGDPVTTAAVLTGPAPEQLTWLHERAPLAVPDRFLDTWLAADGRDAQAVLDTLVGVGHPPLLWYEVGPDIGQVRIKAAHLMQPAAMGVGPVTDPTGTAPLLLF